MPGFLTDSKAGWGLGVAVCGVMLLLEVTSHHAWVACLFSIPRTHVVWWKLAAGRGNGLQKRGNLTWLYVVCHVTSWEVHLPVGI